MTSLAAIRLRRARSFCLALALGIVVTSRPLARADDDDDDKRPKKIVAPGTDPNQVTLTPAAALRYGITLEAARKRTVISHLSVPARVAFGPTALAVVGCPVQGRVVEMGPNVGDAVEAGDKLLLVESPELGEAQSDLRLKLAALDAARFSVDPAKNAYERAKALYESSKGISLTELEKREVDYRTAQNALTAAKATLESAQSKLTLMGMDETAIAELAKSGKINPRYVVRSPLAGAVIERDVTLGELVKPDREKLLIVADMTTLVVLADVPEARIDDVAVGASVRVVVPARPNAPLEAKATRVGLSVDPASRTVRVEAELKAGASVKPGMFAEAEISCSLAGDKGEQAVLAVPSSAVLTVAGSPCVFVQTPGKPNTFQKRAVTVGRSAGGVTAIASGLDDGETVVVAGGSILKAEVEKGAAASNE